METHLIKFYRGTGKDAAGRTIFDIWKFTDEQLEKHHDFIQWLFPLREKSNFNINAPVLSTDDIRLFHYDQELSAHVFSSFNLMMRFYGYQTGSAEKCQHTPSSNFISRTNDWVSPGNHNFLRITRILKFLVLINHHHLASCFFEALTALHSSHKNIIGNSFQFWSSAVRV